jgi:hypothetical protein
VVFSMTVAAAAAALSCTRTHHRPSLRCAGIVNVDDVVAVTFQNLSYTTELHKLISPGTGVRERRMAVREDQEWGR